ncbi:Uncharacterised protein [uncultured archaeon]|nr:Uncharacterised protein [uncultured archaeon]
MVKKRNRAIDPKIIVIEFFILGLAASLAFTGTAGAAITVNAGRLWNPERA